MAPYSSVLNLIPIPTGVLFLIVTALVIVGTLAIISRRNLTTIESLGLLLLVWVIPFIGFIAAVAYMGLVTPRRR